MKTLLLVPLFLTLFVAAAVTLDIPEEVLSEKYSLHQWNTGDTATHRWIAKMLAAKERDPEFEKLLESSRIPKEGHVLEEGEVRVCEEQLDNFILKVCSNAKINSYFPRILENRCCYRGCTFNDVAREMCPENLVD